MELEEVLQFISRATGYEMSELSEAALLNTPKSTRSQMFIFCMGFVDFPSLFQVSGALRLGSDEALRMHKDYQLISQALIRNLPAGTVYRDLAKVLFWHTLDKVVWGRIALELADISPDFVGRVIAAMTSGLMGASHVTDLMTRSSRAVFAELKLKDKIISCYPFFKMNDVHIIGCGGTGARLVPLVAQFMGLYYPESTLHLWDGDIVEANNLERQLFIPADLGKYKASVLERRYKVLHGNVKAHNVMFTVRHARNVKPFSAVMMCVDSLQTRKDIIRDMVRQAGSSSGGGIARLFIDGGNTDSWGQVTTFTNQDAANNTVFGAVKLFEDQKKGLVDLGFAPVPYDLYGGPVGGTGVSCGGMEQSMAINSLIASGMFAALQNWHFDNPLLTSVVFYGLDGQVRSPITLSEVLRDPVSWEQGGDNL